MIAYADKIIDAIANHHAALACNVRGVNGVRGLEALLLNGEYFTIANVINYIRNTMFNI